MNDEGCIDLIVAPAGHPSLSLAVAKRAADRLGEPLEPFEFTSKTSEELIECAKEFNMDVPASIGEGVQNGCMQFTIGFFDNADEALRAFEGPSGNRGGWI